MHYLDAWKAAPEGEEGAAVAAQARVTLRAAAERAANLHSPGQALSYLNHALTVTVDPLERAAVLERAAAAANDSADFAVAERYWQEAIAIYREHDDLSALARVHAALGLGLALTGDLDRSIAILTPVYEELTDRLDDPGVVALTASLARAHALKRQGWATAIELADRALVAAERLDLIDIVADAVITKGVGLGQSHRLREALILLSGVMAMAEARGLVVADLRARINISQFALSDDPRLSLEAARVGVERAQKLGLRARETILAGNAFFAALFTGDWDWAIATAPEVLREEPMRFGMTEVFGYPLLMRAFRGETEGVAEGIALMGASVQESTDPQYRQMMAWIDAAVALAEGRLESAAAAVPKDLDDPTYGSLAYAMTGHAALWLRDPARARRALAGLDGLQIRGRLFDAGRRAVQAGVAALEGRPADAQAGFIEAARHLRDLGLPFPLALTQLDLLATLGPEGPVGQAASSEAFEILTSLRAVTLLERLDQLTTAGAPKPRQPRRTAPEPAATVAETPGP
jgi:tetratricopeptide (TPR) repeat protein